MRHPAQIVLVVGRLHACMHADELEAQLKAQHAAALAALEDEGGLCADSAGAPGAPRMRKSSQALVGAKNLPKLISAALEHVEELARELEAIRVSE